MDVVVRFVMENTEKVSIVLIALHVFVSVSMSVVVLLNKDLTMTEPNDEKLLKEVEYYNAVVEGKTLNEMVRDDLTLQMVLGMMNYRAQELGLMEVIKRSPGLATIITQAIVTGIWLGETGKTKLLEREIQ